MSYHSTGYNATQMESNDGHSLADARDNASSQRQTNNINLNQFNAQEQSNLAFIARNNATLDDNADVLDYMLQIIKD